MFDKIPKGFERPRDSVRCNCLNNNGIVSNNIGINIINSNNIDDESETCVRRKPVRTNLIYTTDITRKVTEMNKKEIR